MIETLINNNLRKKAQQMQPTGISWLILLVAFFLFLITVSSCNRTDSQIETIPIPVEFEKIYAKGELMQRAMRNFDRLETDIYHPENVFPVRHHVSSASWPGDKEGRVMLALVLETQATHRTPLYLEEMIRILPEKLNEKGYLGNIQQDTIDEQQLSGHGWLLRALCEYYLWKETPEVKTYIENIINNLALPTKNHHKNYPISPDERIGDTGGMSGSSLNIVNNWKLSSDVGCDFIFMDGLVQAYSLFPSEELKALIDEMITRFLEMDLVVIKAQTHATLTALRAAMRYDVINGNKELLPEIEKRYKLYKEQAITENYENYNWFERPEWTEPCAIIDAWLLVIQLWQQTQDPVYLEDAQHIYYNAIGHTQRSNGGFGCDNCVGPVENSLSVALDEAYWCCTMRGGEGLSMAVRYSYFVHGDTIIIPSFNSSSVTFHIKDTSLKIGQKTEYPFGNKVLLSIDSLKTSLKINLKLFAPSWINNPVILKNNKPVRYKIENGFAICSIPVQEGDSIEYSFSMDSGVQGLVNTHHSKHGYARLFYGPLLLGYKGDSEISIPENTKIVKLSDNDFMIEGKNIYLSTVYHLMDAKVCASSEYRKQILFTQKPE